MLFNTREIVREWQLHWSQSSSYSLCKPQSGSHALKGFALFLKQFVFGAWVPRLMSLHVLYHFCCGEPFSYWIRTIIYSLVITSRRSTHSMHTVQMWCIMHVWCCYSFSYHPCNSVNRSAKRQGTNVTWHHLTFGLSIKMPVNIAQSSYAWI